MLTGRFTQSAASFFARINNLLPQKKFLNGRSVAVSSLGLGGGTFGNSRIKINDETVYETIKQAWLSGIRYFDCSTLYGVGLSLKRMGFVLQDYPREEYTVSSKVGFVIEEGRGNERSSFDSFFLDGQDNHVEADYTAAGIIKSFEQNLKLLQLDYLDIALVHDLGEYVHKDQHKEKMDDFFNKGGLEALQKLREEGKAKAIGLGVNEWQVCVEVIKRGFIPDCIMLAGRYTLLDQSALGEFFELCEKHKISVIVAGVYNSGILSGDPANESFNYTQANKDIHQRKEDILAVCKSYKVLLPTLALQFPHNHPQVISVVTGARSPKEIQESADNMTKEVDIEVYYALKQADLIAKDAFAPMLAGGNKLSNN